LSAGSSTSLRFLTSSYSLNTLVAGTQSYPALFFTLREQTVSPGFYSAGRSGPWRALLVALAPLRGWRGSCAPSRWAA
jgi:hypothetical protein